RECISTYIPLYIRTELIKTLYKSLEYRYAGVDEIVRRLAKVFAILRLRAKVLLELGLARFYDIILVIYEISNDEAFAALRELQI
ncbi:hypothetical protein COCSADRAFT_77269, partial [Bipolaris sorokiniana ND90Pr]